MNPSPDLTRHGRLAVRYVKALAVGDRIAARGFAEAQSSWPERATIVSALKAAITATSADDAAALMAPIGSDFARFVMPMTIVGRLVGLHRIPLQTRLLTSRAAATAFWLGEGSPAPLSRLDLAGETLAPRKVVGMAVATQELLRASGIASETEIGATLAAAAVAALDAAFLDPTNSGIAGVKPASATAADLVPIVSSGATLAAVDADLKLMIFALATAGSNLEFAHWVLSPHTAVSLALLRGSGGTLAYPNISAKGGTLCGLPVLVSANMPTGGSPSATSIVLLDAAQIRFGDEGASEIAIAESATLEMRDDPSNDAGSGTATTQVSMYQTNSVAIRLTRFCNWATPTGAAAIALVGVEY